MAADSSYSYPIGALFFFNLMVGTGTLSMPNEFGKAGYILSVILLVVIGFISYVALTFMTEALSIANAAHTLALRKLNYQKELHDNPVNEDQDVFKDYKPLVHAENKYAENELDDLTNEEIFDITTKFEMGQLCKMFAYHKWWTIFFYVCICIYLYGDLAIYAVAVPKSIRDVICSNLSHFEDLSDSDECWNGKDLTRMDMYRIILAVFAFTFGAFTYFDVTKTTLLQVCTGIVRWTSLIMMVTLACRQIANGNGATKSPKWFSIDGLFGIFGVLIYAFMCHHSIPTLVLPLKSKKYVKEMALFDYFCAGSFYALNSVVAVFAFGSLDDLYSENFVGSEDIAMGFKVFIGLFPALVLCTSFPIIGVVLRNNLKALFMQILERDSFPFWIDRIVFPTACLLLPIMIAMITDDVTSLMNVTGGLSGALIEYFFPALIVFYARRHLMEIERINVAVKCPSYCKSYFRHVSFVYALFVWTLVCLVMTIINLST